MGAPSTDYTTHDLSAWQQARELDTAQAYSTYLSLWPSGKFAAEAKRRMHQIKEESLWSWAGRQHQIVAYEQYLAQFPEGYYSREAYEQISSLEEQSAWDKASRTDTIAGYLEFRREFPDSSFSEEAAQRIVGIVKSRNSSQRPPAQPATGASEETALEKATMQDSVMAYNQFLKDFPDSQHQPAVRKRIDQLQQRLNSEFHLLENEVEAWDNAARLHTRYAYQEYLSHFPHGKFSNLAQSRLRALDQQWRWKHRMIIEENAKRNESTGDDSLSEMEAQSTQAARSLGWLWMTSLFVLGGLSIWLAPYLLPLVVVLGLALGAHLVMNRGARLTRNESLPYLFGGSISMGALVQGLIFQLTGQIKLSLLCGTMVIILTSLGLIRYFQIQMDRTGDE